MPTLTAYTLDAHQLTIRPAPPDRDWMNASTQRFAYRCLPLNIANSHGWEFLNPYPFAAYWDGNKEPAAVKVLPDTPDKTIASGHFGHGVLTFQVNVLFRTDPGTDLYVTGPINRPKDAVSPLTGIVEADWAPYTFTMNWVFTRPGLMTRFERDEPFCHIFPTSRGQLEATTPTFRPLSSDPALERENNAWSAERAKFNSELDQPDSQAAREKWQKHYFRGKTFTSSEQGVTDHRSKLRLEPFRPHKPE